MKAVPIIHRCRYLNVERNWGYKATRVALRAASDTLISEEKD